MNKKLLVIILIVGLVIFLLITFWLGSVLKLGVSQKSTQETLIDCSLSPDGKYELEAYKTEPGATVDFSIKVYMKIDNKKKLIYNAYHEHEVEIKWISDNEVSINKKILNLSENETFDWRKN